MGSAQHEPRNPDPHSRGFDTAPKPEGWIGGSDDFTFLGFGGGPGRLGINLEVDDGEFDPTGYHVRQNPDCRHLFEDYQEDTLGEQHRSQQSY